eukprot:gene25067-33580_t
MIDDLCFSNSVVSIEWGQGPFNYEKGAYPSQYCQIGPIQIGYMNIYGSQKVGPYLHGHGKCKIDPYADTQERIPQALTRYIASFGTPQFIFYRTELWDLQPNTAYLNQSQTLHEGVNDEEKVRDATRIMDEFTANHEWAVDYLRSLVPTAYIGSHTVPNIKWGMHLFHHYANRMRYNSKKMGTFLFDWNLLLLSHRSDSYLRDFHHPTKNISISFTNIVLRSLQAWACSFPILNSTSAAAPVEKMVDELVAMTAYGLAAEKDAEKAVINAICVYDNTLDSSVCNTLSDLLTNYAVKQINGTEHRKDTVLSIPFRVFDRSHVTADSTNAGFKFVEKVIDSILNSLQDDSRFVEYWWRGHWSNHVLHRDVDELSCFRDNVQRYPRNAHVLYLSYEESLVSESGGHTVVLEDDTDRTRNLFIVPPLPGRLLRFDGQLLHGVPRPALEYFLHDQSGVEVKLAVEDTLLQGGQSEKSTLDVAKLSFTCDFSNSIRRSVILFNTWSDVPPAPVPTPSEDCMGVSPNIEMLSNVYSKWYRREFLQQSGKSIQKDKNNEEINNKDRESVCSDDSDWTLRFLLPPDRRRRDSYEKSLALSGSRADVAGFLIHDTQDRPPTMITLKAIEE